jgi:anti-sigma regulatory factor (Ser/Thr protein kinase)
MGPILRLQLEARIPEVRRLNAAAARFLSAERISSDAIHDVQLVLEEITTNVIRHGAPAGDAAVTMNVELEVEQDSVRVTLEDDAAPFDPTSIPETPPRADDWPGGYGLRIVRRTATGLRYGRNGAGNVLEMRVPLRSGPAS